MASSVASSNTKRKRGNAGGNKFYVVKAGRKPGVYYTWADCQEQTSGYAGAVFKSFGTLTEAQDFLKGTSSTASTSTSNDVSSKIKKFYAVARGKVPGVYETWAEAQPHITGHHNPMHKSFLTHAEADAFVKTHAHEQDINVFASESADKNGTVETTNSAIAAAPAKKAKTAKVKVEQPTGPGYDPFVAEDDFDRGIIMDLASGNLRYKTAVELDALKLMPRTEHHDKVLEIWTDGACPGNGKPGSTAGLGVYFGPQDNRNLYESLPNQIQSNNRGELMAIKRALQIAPMNRPVRINTDSKYSIDCCEKYAINWRAKKWKLSSGEPVKNKDIIEDILDILEARALCRASTKFRYVKGHSNDPGNEAADVLARAGAAEGKRLGFHRGASSEFELEARPDEVSIEDGYDGDPVTKIEIDGDDEFGIADEDDAALAEVV